MRRHGSGSAPTTVFCWSSAASVVVPPPPSALRGRNEAAVVEYRCQQQHHVVPGDVVDAVQHRRRCRPAARSGDRHCEGGSPRSRKREPLAGKRAFRGNDAKRVKRGESPVARGKDKSAPQQLRNMLQQGPIAPPGARCGPVERTHGKTRVVTSSSGGRSARRLRGIAMWRKGTVTASASSEGDGAKDQASTSESVLSGDVQAKSRLASLEYSVEQIEARLVEKVRFCPISGADVPQASVMLHGVVRYRIPTRLTPPRRRYRYASRRRRPSESCCPGWRQTRWRMPAHGREQPVLNRPNSEPESFS